MNQPAKQTNQSNKPIKYFILTGLLVMSAIAHAADRKPNFIFVILPQ